MLKNPVFTILLLLVAGIAHAGQPAFRTRFPRKVVPGQPMLVCKRVKQPPKIDGEVDKDPVWRTCNRTQGAWVQMGTKKSSSRQTVVYACFDSKNIYFGFVCEETDLSRVRMSGDLKNADSVEVVLEIGGLQGLGDTYSFLANTNSRTQSWGFTTNKRGHRPREEDLHPWQSAGKFGPNRWMVEMVIPFSSLRRKQSAKRIADPQRGDLIGVKFARYGKTLKSAEPRMISTTSVSLPSPFLYICGHNTLLYFEDSNVLKDGNLTKPTALSPWKSTGRVETGKDGLRLSANATLTQQARLRPRSYYRVQADADEPALLEISLAGRPFQLDKHGRGGCWIEKVDHAARFELRALKSVKLMTVQLRYNPGEEPPGAWCLTNNYRTPERNISSKLPNIPMGKYRYVAIDYADRILKDDNPSFVKDIRKWDWFPYLRVEDRGGTEGWIRFDRGSLTGGKEAVFWQTDCPKHAGFGRAKHRVVDIDLGQEYFVTGLDVWWPAPYTENMEIWGKQEKSPHWTLMYTGTGTFVEPSKRKDYLRGYDRLRGLDSVVRFLRWRSTQLRPQKPPMDGIQEFWVWGEPQGKRSSLKAFKPWVSGKKVPPQKPRTWIPSRNSAQIIPPPKQLEKQAGLFVVKRDTLVVYQDEPEARRIAGQIQEEIRERWGLQIQVSAEQAMEPAGKSIIYLGQPRLGGMAQDLAKRERIDVDGDSFPPQGYGLNATPERVVILGRDRDGLYGGAQSLMMAMRWHQTQDRAKTGPSVQAMKILDWPDFLERAAYNGRGYAVMFTMPLSETYRIKRMCRLLSRFKFNALYLEALGHYDGRVWPKGTMARLCQEIRQEYHLEVRPTILHIEAEAGGQWKNLIKRYNAWDLAEEDPDNSTRRFPGKYRGSLNFCPLAPETYKYIFNDIDKTLEDFGYPRKVMAWGLAYRTPEYGASWGRCRTCQRSGKTLEQLYAFYLHRIAGHLKRRQTIGLLHSPWLKYLPSPAKHRTVSLDPSMIPGSLHIDLTCLAKPGSVSPEKHVKFLRRYFDPLRTTNGPPSWPGLGQRGHIPNTMPTVINTMCGGRGPLGGSGKSPAEIAIANWHRRDKDGKAVKDLIDYPDLAVWVNSWWSGRDFPSWRSGDPPEYFPVNLRPFANHLSHPTGMETLEPGRPPEIDLRYLPTGVQTLGGVEFDIIDPAQNHNKAVLMLGRPPAGTISQVKKTIQESVGPITINRKLASLAFLRTRWRCNLGSYTADWASLWLRPTCRVVYDDDTWLVVDAFIYPHSGSFINNNWNNSHGDATGFCYRLGWEGNAPSGKRVNLTVAEWVNPYPEKTIKALDFFTPDMEGAKGKRVNPMCEAIVAITGIQPIEQDFTFWSKRGNKPPLLSPPLRLREGTVEAKEPSTSYRIRKGHWTGQFITPKGKISYKAALLPHSGYHSLLQRFPCVSTKSFLPFGVTLEFKKPTHFSHVEIQGPAHCLRSPRGATAPRKQKVDVLIEISADGKQWTRAGELRGISAQADFLSVRLPEQPIKAIRLTGTAKPYHEYYRQYEIVGHLFETLAMRPHFSWRFYIRNSKDAD